MRKWLSLALLSALAVVGVSCDGNRDGPKTAAKAAAEGPNPAMNHPDETAWRLFVKAVSNEGGGPAFESWASDTDTFTPQAAFPSARTAVTPRRGRPTQLALRAHLAVPAPAPAPAGAPAAAAGPAAANGVANPPPPAPNALHNAAREEVRRNRPAFDYIVRNKLNLVSGLKAAYAAVSQDPSKVISFPVDSMEVKTNWLPVTELAKYYPDRVTADPSKNFYIVTATDPKTKQKVQWALLSMHVISKEVPNWTWATFENNANPGRCDIIGCRDLFGAQQAYVPPSATAEGDYGTCAKTDAVSAMLGGVDPVFANYCLKGSQVDFNDPTGLSIRLGNSVTEGGFVQSSSCVTCHGTAGWNAAGNAVNPNVNADLGPIPSAYYWSSTSQIAGAPRAPYQNESNLARIGMSADFVWSIPFCAWDDVGGTGAQPGCTVDDR